MAGHWHPSEYQEVDVHVTSSYSTGRHIEAARGQCRDIVANLHQGAYRAEMAAEGVGVVVGVRVAGVVGVVAVVVAGVVAAS